MQPGCVIVELDAPAHVGDSVVPCRHDFAGQCFFRVPGRRDVGVGAAEDDQHLGSCGDGLPDRVAACDVAVQRAFRAFGACEQHRQVIGSEFAVRRNDQCAERVTLDEFVQDVETVFPKMRRQVHGYDRRRR